MEILKADLDDAATILNIQKSAFLSEAIRYNDYTIPPLQQTLAELKQDFSRQTFLKAVVNSTTVGSIRGFKRGSSCYISRLIVLPEFQGNGIGGELLLQIEKCFSNTYRFELFTGAQSNENLSLYQKNGYQPFNSKPLNENIIFIYLEKIIKQTA